MNIVALLVGVLLAISFAIPASADKASRWQESWPKTDFTNYSVDLSEIISGGPGKDGIPAIDHPRFVNIEDVSNLSDDEPVIGLSIAGEAKAYPLRILIWHEIVNDELGGVPVSVTYCPLCNTSIVFDRRFEGRILDFGTTGNLRHSDLIMYDRQTESWWQQFSGEAIVGKFNGKSLEIIPSRLESFKNYKIRFPKGRVLVPNNEYARRYGTNPYVGYDSSPLPFLYRGVAPKGVKPMMRVVAVDDIAVSLPLLREKGRIDKAGQTFEWRSGQNSALDTKSISDGRDVGNVLVTKDGEDQAHVVTFAFAFFAFHPNGRLFTLSGELPADP